jgi:hypothetical protein
MTYGQTRQEKKRIYVLEPFLTCGSSCNIKKGTNLVYYFSVGSHLDILK